MLFKPSLMLFMGVFAVVLFAEGDCFVIRDFFMDRIVKPIKSIFPTKENVSDNELEVDAREHGSFDSLGRDIIRETSKTFREIKDKISKTFSRDTKGLDCNKTLSDGKVENFKSRIQAIYPGTKWCGDGNISTSYDDLGKFAKTDSCCREHDLCPDNMAADSTKYGLVNTGLFTRSHCDCDRKFYECLKQATSIVADSIGYTYFTVLGPQCFKQDYPIIECLEARKGKCELYETYQEGEKIYQWFDSPVF